MQVQKIHVVTQNLYFRSVKPAELADIHALRRLTSVLSELGCSLFLLKDKKKKKRGSYLFICLCLCAELLEMLSSGQYAPPLVAQGNTLQQLCQRHRQPSLVQQSEHSSTSLQLHRSSAAPKQCQALPFLVVSVFVPVLNHAVLCCCMTPCSPAWVQQAGWIFSLYPPLAPRPVMLGVKARRSVLCHSSVSKWTESLSYKALLSNSVSRSV